MKRDRSVTSFLGPTIRTTRSKVTSAVPRATDEKNVIFEFVATALMNKDHYLDEIRRIRGVASAFLARGQDILVTMPDPGTQDERIAFESFIRQLVPCLYEMKNALENGAAKLGFDGAAIPRGVVEVRRKNMLFCFGFLPSMIKDKHCPGTASYICERKDAGFAQLRASGRCLGWRPAGADEWMFDCATPLLQASRHHRLVPVVGAARSRQSRHARVDCQDESNVQRRLQVLRGSARPSIERVQVLLHQHEGFSETTTKKKFVFSPVFFQVVSVWGNVPGEVACDVATTCPHEFFFSCKDINIGLGPVRLFRQIHWECVVAKYVFGWSDEHVDSANKEFCEILKTVGMDERACKNVISDWMNSKATPEERDAMIEALRKGRILGGETDIYKGPARRRAQKFFEDLEADDPDRFIKLCTKYQADCDAEALLDVLLAESVAKYVIGGLTDMRNADAMQRAKVQLEEQRDNRKGSYVRLCCKYKVDVTSPVDDLLDALLAKGVAKYVMGGLVDLYKPAAVKRFKVQLEELRDHRNGSYVRLCSKYEVEVKSPVDDLLDALLAKGVAKYVMGGLVDLYKPAAVQQAKVQLEELRDNRKGSYVRLCSKHSVVASDQVDELLNVLREKGVAKQTMAGLKGGATDTFKAEAVEDAKTELNSLRDGDLDSYNEVCRRNGVADAAPVDDLVKQLRNDGSLKAETLGSVAKNRSRLANKHLSEEKIMREAEPLSKMSSTDRKEEAQKIAEGLTGGDPDLAKSVSSALLYSARGKPEIQTLHLEFNLKIDSY